MIPGVARPWAVAFFSQVKAGMNTLSDQTAPLDGFDTNGKIPTLNLNPGEPSSSDSNPKNWTPKPA